jgi:hypothetical protein
LGGKLLVEFAEVVAAVLVLLVILKKMDTCLNLIEKRNSYFVIKIENLGQRLSTREKVQKKKKRILLRKMQFEKSDNC